MSHIQTNQETTVQFLNIEGQRPDKFKFSADLILLAEYKGGEIPGYKKAHNVKKGDRWDNRLAVWIRDDLNIDLTISEVSLTHNEIALDIKVDHQHIILVHLVSTSSCEDSDKVRAEQINDLVMYIRCLKDVTIIGDFNCCSSPNLVAKTIAIGIKEFKGATGTSCQIALSSLTLDLQNPGMRTFPTFKPVRGKIYFPAPVLCLDQVWSSQTVHITRERFSNLSDHFGLKLTIK